jgi:Transcription factor subunit Med10 of Mediator complex
MYLRNYLRVGKKFADERYVEDGLNPDKYTRRFVNMLMKDNQFINGKIDAVQVQHFKGGVADNRIFGMYWLRRLERSFLTWRVMLMK